MRGVIIVVGVGVVSVSVSVSVFVVVVVFIIVFVIVVSVVVGKSDRRTDHVGFERIAAMSGSAAPAAVAAPSVRAWSGGGDEEEEEAAAAAAAVVVVVVVVVRVRARVRVRVGPDGDNIVDAIPGTLAKRARRAAPRLRHRRQIIVSAASGIVRVCAMTPLRSLDPPTPFLILPPPLSREARPSSGGEYLDPKTMIGVIYLSTQCYCSRDHRNIAMGMTISQEVCTGLFL